MSLHARGIGCHHHGHRQLHDANLQLMPGTVHALLGANGAGKSTLLRVLAGERRPDAGTVTLDDQPLHRITPGALARRRAVLPQGDALRAGFTARAVVQLGRAAAVTGSAAQEQQRVTTALQQADALAFADRSYLQLSGGERRRVQLARVLAQVALPPGAAAVPAHYLLLDEPIAALDLPHQFACLNTLRQQAQAGLGVLVVLHDLNLAARYADCISLIGQGRVLACGRPAEVLTPPLLRATFGDTLHFQPLPGSGPPRYEIGPRDVGG